MGCAVAAGKMGCAVAAGKMGCAVAAGKMGCAVTAGKMGCAVAAGCAAAPELSIGLNEPLCRVYLAQVVSLVVEESTETEVKADSEEVRGVGLKQKPIGT